MDKRPFKPEFRNSQKQDRCPGDDQCLGKGRRRTRRGAIQEYSGWQAPFDGGDHFPRCRHGDRHFDRFIQTKLSQIDPPNLHIDAPVARVLRASAAGFAKLVDAPRFTAAPLVGRSPQVNRPCLMKTQRHSLGTSHHGEGREQQ